MMQIGIVSIYDKYNKHNGIFDPNSYFHGENLEYPSLLLKERLSQMGMDLNTLDMRPLDVFKAIIFIDMPTPNALPEGVTLAKLREMGKKLYLIMCESKQTKPDNFDKNNHKYFDKIFTWFDPYVDSRRYIKYNLPNKIPKDFSIDRGARRKLCAMIAGNHRSNDPNELYSERIKAIRWFEHNRPKDFDLYGRGWDSEIFRRPSISLPVKLLCLFKPFRIKLDKEYYPSYKGEVISKRDTFSRYKFSICHENAKNVPGYVSEKLFDALFAGTVPVYWGAPNIKDLAPADIFIDMRDFGSFEKLYAYLKSMTNDKYEAYLNSIEEYINGGGIRPFSAENYVSIIIKECFS